MTGKTKDEHIMFEETLYTEPNKKAGTRRHIEFFDWQCVSFVRWNGTSFDLIVRDNSDLMALINIVQ